MAKQSKLFLYIGLGFFAVPVLIFGSSILRIDQSGLATTVYLFFLGIPAILIGTTLVIVSAILARKDASSYPSVAESNNTKLIKRFLIGIIAITLSLPLLYLLYTFGLLFLSFFLGSVRA